VKSLLQLFKVSQNLTAKEATDLYDALKADLQQSSAVDKDAATWSVRWSYLALKAST
jgi:hypothetical protein